MRALEILRTVDVIAAEDKRNTANLLAHHGVLGKTISLHQHNEREMSEKIFSRLSQGQNVALVSDAGTPAISDPGSLLVAKAIAEGFRVVPIPGCNAAIAALCASGMSENGFLFYGFLPPKSTARKKELASLKTLTRPLVFYEAPHRILELAGDLEEVFGKEREVVFARELTKRFETIHRARSGEIVSWLQNDPMQQKGEFVVIVAGHEEVQSDELDEKTLRTLRILLASLPLKQAVQLTAEISGENRNRLYELALAMKKEKEAADEN